MTEAQAIRIERHIAAPPEVVFAHLVDPDLTPKWLGVASTIEPRPGGDFSLLSPNGMTATGAVREIVTDAKVSFTWGWEGHPGVPPGSTLVEIELFPDGEGTRIVLTHRALAAGKQDLHRRGWTHYLDRLEVSAAGGDPGPDRGVGNA